MGYWEQISGANRRAAEERARLPRWRQFDWTNVAATALGVAFWIGLVARLHPLAKHMLPCSESDLPGPVDR